MENYSEPDRLDKEFECLPHFLLTNYYKSNTFNFESHCEAKWD